MNFSKIFSFSILLMLFVQHIQAQEWLSYQSPQQVNDLVDNGDELLLATDAGLVVVNKTTLEKTIFNTSNSNLSNNHIQSITLAPNGDTYIGTYDVIMGMFNGSDIQDVIIPEGEDFDQHTVLYDFEIAENGDFWVGTSDGVFHKQGQTWNHYDEDELGANFFEAWDIEINSAGEVFVASNTIHKYSNNEWTNFSDMTQIFSYLDAELFFSNNGEVYIAGDLDKIGRYDGNQWYEYDNGGLNGSEVIGFTEDVNGTVYFNTLRDGIFKLENDTWVPHVNMQTSAFNNNSSYFYIDEQNNQWLNNNIYLTVYENGTIKSTSISSHTIEYNNVFGIRKGENGNMLFKMNSSTNNIAVVDSEGNWSSLQMPLNSLLWPTIGDILYLDEDDIWIAVNEGVYHFDGIEWIMIPVENCRSLAQDAEGKIYGLASDRIYIFENGNVAEYNTSNSLLSELEVLSGFGIDADNYLWIASFDWSGESLIQKVDNDGNWSSFSDTEHEAIFRPSGNFHFDLDGNVWIPSNFSGAIKFDGTNWTNPIADNSSEIENLDVYAIESDVNGNLYFSHQYGLTTFIDGEWGSLNIESIPNVASSHQSDLRFDNEGTLWWASSRYGVFSYTPGNPTSAASGIEGAYDFSIFPNPTNTRTTLEFYLNEKANVSIKIFNNLGQLVTSMDRGILYEGSYQESIYPNGFQKGLYNVQLQVNNKFSTQTLVIF